MTSQGTVEFGGDRPNRWLDRIFGEPDEAGRRRFSGPAMGCAILAVVLLLGAELLPWLTAGPADGPEQPVDLEREVYLEGIASISALGYYPGWMALLALTGAALVVRRPQTRAWLVAAGLGIAAGLTVILAGLTRRAGGGGGPELPLGDAELGPGLFCAVAAVVLTAAALALSGWQPGLRRPRRAGQGAAEPDEDTGPPDLTVTPLA